MLRHLLLPLLLCCTSCYDSSFSTADPTREGALVSTTLRVIGEGIQEGERTTITTDLVVEGRVTTSDRSGNFYRTFCIESEGAAAEIMAGIDALHNDYPEGSRIVVSLKGLAVGRRLGVLQIGRPTEIGSYYPVDYLGSKAALDRYCTRTTSPLIPIEPTRRLLSELSLADCGCLIRIENLHHAPEEVVENCWKGYQRFADANGAAIYTYVRDYADFADQPLPTGNCTLIGILQYNSGGEGRYLLKLRDETDCVQ